MGDLSGSTLGIAFRGEPGVRAHFVERRPCLYLDRHVGAGVLVLKCSTYMESISKAKETSRSRNALHVYLFQKFYYLQTVETRNNLFPVI